MKHVLRVTGVVALVVGGLAVSWIVSSGAAAPLAPTVTRAKHPPPPRPTPRPALPKCTIKGTRGADFLHGTRKADVICGFSGADHIWAGPNDIVDAGAGRDTIYSRNGGPNLIVGGRGADRARSDRSVDLLFAVERLLP